MEDELDAPEPIEPDTLEAEAEATPEEVEEVEEEPKGQEPSDPSPEPEAQKKSDAVQKRIDELTRRRRETERERDYWREQAQQKAEPEPKEEPLKTLEDFDYDEKAYQQHLFEQAKKESVEEAKKAWAAEQQQEAAKRKLATFRQREAEFAKNATDYFEAVSNPELAFSQAMVEITNELDNGPEIRYYLANNPDLSYEIANLSPLLAAREIGRIEAKLSEKPSGKTVSDAPTPPPKLAAKDPVITKKLEDMSQREFNEYRRKQIAKRRR